MKVAICNPICEGFRPISIDSKCGCNKIAHRCSISAPTLICQFSALRPPLLRALSGCLSLFPRTPKAEEGGPGRPHSSPLRQSCFRRAPSLFPERLSRNAATGQRHNEERDPPSFVPLPHALAPPLPPLSFRAQPRNLPGARSLPVTHHSSLVSRFTLSVSRFPPQGGSWMGNCGCRRNSFPARNYDRIH